MTEPTQNKFLQEPYRREVWNTILATINEKEKTSKVPVYWRRYAAAAVLLITCGCIAFWPMSKKHSPVTAKKTHARIINPTANIYRVTMQDGSTVTLYPKSEIFYRQPFGEKDRYLTLTGKAVFDVAENKMIPFRVVAKSVMTTAVGTSFTIVGDSLENEVNIFLHSGKVVVEQEGQGSAKVYLKPGQAINWNISKKTFAFSKRPAPPKKIIASKKTEPVAPKDFEMAFERSPLPEVLKNVRSRFSISIHYDPDQLRGLYFSGTIKSTDKPVRILERIAALYDLTIQKKAEGYRISKN